jgi:hypothetical protein
VEAASAHREDTGRTVNVGAGAEAAHYSIVEEASAAGSSCSDDMKPHRDWDTSAELEDSLGCG